LNGISRSTENIAGISKRAWCMTKYFCKGDSVQSNVIRFKGRALRRPAKARQVQLCTVLPVKSIFTKAPKTVCDVMSSFIIRKGKEETIFNTHLKTYLAL
jgi:hypothetical protein